MRRICSTALVTLAVGLLVAVAPPADATIVEFTITPGTVYGSQPATGDITLNLAFPPQPRTVTLTSSNPSVASVPASVAFPLGALRRTFPITTFPTNVQRSVVITATQGNTVQRTIVVIPPSLTGVTFNPNPVVGGQTSIATVTINYPAPSNWLCSIQGPYPPIYFMTGSIVSFTPGATSTTKQVNTQSVFTPVNAQICVNPPSGQSPGVCGTLLVNPIGVQMLTLEPSVVTAGDSALGCVTLNAPAPAGGANVMLSSSDPAVASVPQTLLIPGGQTYRCFIVDSSPTAACTSVQITATYGGLSDGQTFSVGDAVQLTDNAQNDHWGTRHRTTSRGNVLWTNGADVYVDDGTSTQLVQALGNLGNVEPAVFGLGGGSNPTQVIGAWRRGTDFAWVWTSGGQPVQINAVNPFIPTDPMNPEALAIADGSLFMVWQATVNNVNVKNVFRVDPVTGNATNLTGASIVPGAPRVTTSGGRAAWLFDDNSGNPKLHFYNGTSVSEIDSGPISSISLRLVRGRLVYEKTLGGISHVFLYDSTVANAIPVRLSPDTDATHGNFAPATDGYHAAWLYGNADRTNLHVMLNGGMQLSDNNSRPVMPAGNEFPLQLQRGQLLWKDTQSRLRYHASGQMESICETPASSFTTPWLADGLVVGFGPVLDSAETDNEVFVHAGIAPNDADRPMPPILLEATAGNRSANLEWDGVLGASSYNIYLAEQAGVTKDNYASLPGGQRLAGIASREATVSGLTNGVAYYFVVTAVENGDEGANSMEALTTPGPLWTPVGNSLGITFHAVAADPVNPNSAFAAGGNSQSGNVYRTSDGGFTWTQLGGAIAGRRTRALAVRGDAIFAVTIDGDVLRSNNAGANWAVVADGDGYGQIVASIAIDPSDPQTVYAGSVVLTPDAQSRVIKSINGGDTWSHTNSGQIIPYCLAADSEGVVYAGGSAIPAIGRSTDGGTTWTDVTAVLDQTYSFAVDPMNDATLFAGTGSNGFYRSQNSGASWVQHNNGLPLGAYEAVYAIVVDPVQAGAVYLGTARGPFVSSDNGDNWTPSHVGMGPIYTYGLTRTASGRLIAATSNGLFLLDVEDCPGDLNGDGVVGLGDLTILLGHFGMQNAEFEDGDIDGDGAVDLGDLTILLGNFGVDCG